MTSKAEPLSRSPGNSLIRRVRIAPRGTPSAVRHGGYTTGLLPGEDRAAFQELHRGLVAEYSPTGPSQEDVVWTMTRIIWRKNHMDIVRAATGAWDRYRRIESRLHSEMAKEMLSSYTVSDELPPEARKMLRKKVEDEAREELGDDYRFIEAGSGATLEVVMNHFDVEARLDSILDVCLKRLLHMKGLQSLSSSTSSAPRLSRPDSDNAA